MTISKRQRDEDWCDRCDGSRESYRHYISCTVSWRVSIDNLSNCLAVAAGLQLSYDMAEVDCAFRPRWEPNTQGRAAPGWTLTPTIVMRY